MNILIASLATAGAASFLFFNTIGTTKLTVPGPEGGDKPRPEVYASAQTESKQPPAKPEIQQEQKTEVIEQNSNNEGQDPGKAMADMPKTEFRNDGQIDIKGVNLIESDDKLLSELGLGKSPNGINIWLKGEGRSPMVCTLLVSGGLSMRENEKENKQTVPFKNLMPRLITDNAGNKRLAIFDDNSSLAQYSRRIEDNGPADGSRNVMADFKTTVLINDNKSDSSGLKPDNAPDQLGRINSPRINLHIEGLDTNWSRQFRQLNVQLDTLLKGRLKDVEAMLKKLNIDNGNIRKFIVPPIGMPNKEMKELEQKAADLEKQALGLDKEALGLEKKALRIEKDARKQNKMQSLEKSGKLREDAIELHDKASDLRDRALELREKAMQIREKSFELPDTSDFNFDMNFDFDYPDSDSDEDINMNDIINDVKIRISNNITPIMTRIDALEDNMNNLVKINKLIPIEVKMGRNPDRNYYNNNEDFSFILWYEPTEEFLKALPAEYRQRIEPEVKALQAGNNICQSAPVAADEAYFDIWRSCSGAVENLAVFPNPASDFINVKYNLSQARNIEISLHDLSGRKIRSLSSFDMCPAGPMDRKFQLNDLQPGMYLVSVQTDKNEQAVQRVVVEK